MVSPEIGWALDSYEDTVMRTEDGGVTWFVVGYAYKPNYINQRAMIHALDESRVVYSFGIFDMTVGDRASNIPWDLKENIHSSATGNPVGLFVLDDNTIWMTLHVGLRAGGAVAIYRTRDGGLSWELILVDSMDSFLIGDLFMVDENTGWLSG
jgi:hypothetical protein